MACAISNSDLTVLHKEADQATMRAVDGDAKRIERRLDLLRPLRHLRLDDLALCSQLIKLMPTKISESGDRSRASIYRQISHIRRLLGNRRLATCRMSEAGTD